MSKTLKLLLLAGCIFFSTLLAGQGKVIFVHGWNVIRDDYQPFAAEFISLFPGCEVTMREWDASDVDFGKSLVKAGAEAERLADELSRMSAAEREKTVLVGHSLGGLIVIKAMAILAERKLVIDRGIFLGAAIADDDPAIEAAITASKRTNVNVYHPQDHILRDVFTGYNLLNKQRISALGAFGYSQKCLKSRLFQLRAAEYVEPEDVKGYAREMSINHLLRQYLVCLKAGLPQADNVPAGEIDSSTAVPQVTVPGMLPGKNIPLPQPLRYWSKSTLLASYGQWRLFMFRKKEDKKFMELAVYYIVDPRERIIGWTMSRRIAVAAFDSVKEQLLKEQ